MRRKKRIFPRETEYIQPVALVREPQWGYGLGIAVELGENMGGIWEAGKVVIFWQNGEITVPGDDGVQVLIPDLWKHLAGQLEGAS